MKNIYWWKKASILITLIFIEKDHPIFFYENKFTLLGWEKMAQIFKTFILYITFQDYLGMDSQLQDAIRSTSCKRLFST